MTNDLYGLYDRQIRLFGRETQRLIESACVYVVQGPPYILNTKMRTTDIGGEILKNLVLLGVRTIFTDEIVKSSFSRVSPNDVSKINDEVDVRTEVGKETYTVAIFVDKTDEVESDVGIYVCSRCMSFHDIKKEHVCAKYVLNRDPFAGDCLLGAIVVQEWIKRVQNASYVEEYQLKL